MIPGEPTESRVNPSMIRARPLTPPPAMGKLSSMEQPTILGSCFARARVGSDLGSFRLTGLLGEGAQAAVYVAEAPLVGGRVALKVMHPEHADSAAARARFLREPRIANTVAEVHEGAVPIFLLGIAPSGAPFFDAPFFVMPLLHGRSLEARLADSCLSWGGAAALGMAVADILVAADQLGVVHRDIKPGNLFLTRDRKVKLLDFGIGKANALPGGALTAAGALLGTVDFMAPEAAQGRDIGGRGDVFSLAATMVTAMAGRPMRGEGPPLELLVRAATQAPPPVATIVPGVPRPVAQLLDAALALDPRDRPSARAFQTALAAACNRARTG